MVNVSTIFYEVHLYNNLIHSFINPIQPFLFVCVKSLTEFEQICLTNVIPNE